MLLYGHIVNTTHLVQYKQHGVDILHCVLVGVHTVNMDSFGKNVALIREELNIARAELHRRLAERGAQMHMTTLRRIEAGEQEPKLSEAALIADALEVPLETLTMGAEASPTLLAVRVDLAKYRSVVNAVFASLSAWEEQSKALRDSLKKAYEAGVPEKLLIEAANDLGRTDEVDSLAFAWQQATSVKDSWLPIHLKEAFSDG